MSIEYKSNDNYICQFQTSVLWDMEDLLKSVSIVSIPPIYVIFVSVSTISFNKKRKKKKTIQKNTNIIEQTRIFSSII